MTSQKVRRCLRFNVLGPLEGWSGGDRLRLGGTIRERVLVALLLETGNVLPLSRLVNAVWGEDPPPTAAHQIRKAIADLRRIIPDGTSVLVTDGRGYRAQVTDTELDLAEFRGAVSCAATAAEQGRAADAVEALRTAIALWRGPVLPDGGGPLIEAASTMLYERYLTAAERLYELRLGLGESVDLVVDLRELVDRHPLRETLRCQLMLALYRAGRQAEALDEYTRVRALLSEELGIDPGPRLISVYEGILRDSPEVGSPVPGSADPRPPSASGSGVPAPCTLPYDLADFSGRAKEVGELLAQARTESGYGTRIVVIDGMGGCGKTTLAVHAAHQLSAEFPDGQLYLDLQGYTAGDRQPIPAETALGDLLRACNIAEDAIPDGIAGRTALWRATLNGKRLLLLLDNAADAVAIRPLLPTDRGCLVLITSRTRLVDLDGAEWISLDVMSAADSATLIEGTLGSRRVAAEPEAALELTRLCGHLPLALRIATARLRNRPRWTLQYLVERLRDETRRLDELDSGERSVDATLRLSYQALDEKCRNVFRFLALHPGHTVDVQSVAAMLDSEPKYVEDILERLLDVHFLQQPDIGLYAMHELVRTFARGLHDDWTGPADTLAVERLLTYYLTATETACGTLFPGRHDRPTGIARSGAELPELADAGSARDWFRREHAVLLNLVPLAERYGYHRHTVWLARNIAFSLNASGYLNEFAQVSRAAVGAARRLGEPAMLGVSLSNLGVACWSLGLLAEGMTVAEEGLAIAVQVGDRHTEAHSESSLGLYKSLLGRFPEALTHLQRAIAHERELGSARAEVETLTVLSTLYEQWGRYREATVVADRAVALARQLGHHESELVALTDSAFAYAGSAEYGTAAEYLTRARELCDETRDPGQVAITLALSADIAHRLGEPAQVSGLIERSLALGRSSASPLRRAKVENMVGRLMCRTGEHSTALALHTDAHELTLAAGYRPEHGYALAGMAEATRALGDEQTAAGYRLRAAELFTAMGVHGRRDGN
ncbi:BTAD domain-containing putative transcriptional regulator [Nocardia sp. NPDC052254]|uniref:AfsR/SARP family transcriptional regulator n=1 Tax=Nocardia sp. NPDC052254 TaxID=3155681 RepID=UPI00343CE29B